MELVITNINKTYPGRVKALEDVSLTIPTGMYGLLGPTAAPLPLASSTSSKTRKRFAVCLAIYLRNSAFIRRLRPSICSITWLS
jgi:hypothetical protein